MSHYNRDDVDWMIENLTKKKGTPYQMGNEELADFCFPYVRIKYPEAKLFKIGNSQYVTITKRAENALIKALDKRKKEHEEAIREYERMIMQIEDATFKLKYLEKGE